MDYAKLSDDLVPLVGGLDNVESFTNCMTRLRLNVADQSAVDAGAIRALDGVVGVVEGPQLQVVVGPGHAQRLRDAFAERAARGTTRPRSRRPSPPRRRPRPPGRRPRSSPPVRGPAGTRAHRTPRRTCARSRPRTSRR